jgi:hypothetical protein
LLRRAAAAVLGEEGEQHVHRLEPCGIDHRTAFAPDRDQPRLAQPVEMKGQRVRRELERFGHGAGWHPLQAGLHQQPEHIEPIVLSERGQGRDGIRLFHISTIIELLVARQRIFR